MTSKVPTLPKKLLDSILAWEYIDLADLLPEQLTASTPYASSNQIIVLPESSWDTRRRKKRQIPDLATWVEVFTTYLLALSSRFPEMLRDLITYQLFIVKHSKRFKYPSWLFYDEEYRKWAAANNIRNWSITNSELYSLAFTGQALAIKWCPVCQVEGGNHTYELAHNYVCPCPDHNRPELCPNAGSHLTQWTHQLNDQLQLTVYFLTRMGGPAHMVSRV